MFLLFHQPGLILTTFITLLFTATIPVHRVNSEPTQDKQALIAFISLTPHANRIQWNRSNSVCTWTGVECDPTQSYVSTLRLPGTGLVGEIPANTLGRLKQLRVLSLRSNGLSGKIPADFSNLVMLRSLYLQNNLFSDNEFPASFTGLARLVRLDLSSNNFSGSIPFAVNNLTHLTGLFLENNRFSGNLPSINPPNLADFNVSNNNLNGSIPKSLQKFPISAFAGNLNLCGGPLPECSSFFPSPTPSPSSDILPIPLGAKSKKLSKGAIIAIAVSSALFLLILLSLLLFCLRRRKQRKTPTPAPKPALVSRSVVAAADAGTSSSKDDVTGGSMETEKKKLVFLGNGKYSFDLEDLLRASAEVLGKGSIGTSYKAVLEEGTTVVVKRLKDVVVTKSEFDAQMEVLGNIRHDNVVPFQAYYFSKDEKLLISDYMASGSLSSLLHGSRGSGRTPLDWENRKKIALSTAKGIAYLHNSGNLVHGNIKSSNVLLRPDHDVALSDFGLNPLFGSATPPNRVAGYRAPEILETRRVTYQSDVYSFGVLLLELLTGKAPNQASLGDEGIDLPRWVQSVVREEWTAEVFDAELMRYNNIEEEMVSLLQIAMSCVSYMPDQRPKIQEVVRLLEDLNNDGLRHSSDDPSKGSGGQTPPMESRTPPRSVTP